MKKLLALIGAVATAFGLYAAGDPTANVFATSFEANQDGVEGLTFDPSYQDSPWLWQGDLLSLSLYPNPSGRPDGYDSTRRTGTGLLPIDNYNYLNLDTGTNTLSLGVTGNVFVDQLVKFTGFEEMQTEFGDNAKIAVWMLATENDASVEPAIEGVTNLYVTVGKWDGEKYAPYSLRLVGNYAPEKWYRLTVKSIGEIFQNPQDASRDGYIVFIDGVQVASNDADANDLVGTTLTTKAAAYMEAGQLFPAISGTASSTFASVSYKGIGGVDDIVADAAGPDFAQEATFTITAIPGISSFVVSNATDSAEIEAEDGSWTVAKGTTVHIYPIPEEDAFLNKTFVAKTITGDGVQDLSGDITVTPASCYVTVDTKVTYFLTLEEAIAFAEQVTGNSIVITSDDAGLEGVVEDFEIVLTNNETIAVTASGWSVTKLGLSGTITNRAIVAGSVTLAGNLTVGAGATLDVAEVTSTTEKITLAADGTVRGVETDIESLFANVDPAVTKNFDGDSWSYALAAAPAVTYQVTLVNAGEKATVLVNDIGQNVASNATITGRIKNIASGYKAYVFIGGEKVEVDDNGYFNGTATKSAAVAVAYVKDTAWYLNPVIRNKFQSSGTYSPIGATTDETESYIAHGFSPGDDSPGMVLYDAETLFDSVNPRFATRKIGSGKVCPTAESERFIAISAALGVAVGSPYYSQGVLPVYPLAGDWSGADDARTYATFKDSGLGASLYQNAFGKDGLYLRSATGDTVGNVYRFALESDGNGGYNELEALDYVYLPTGGGLSCYTINNKDILYAASDAALYAVDYAAGTIVTNAISLTGGASFGTLRSIEVTGLADGVPHVTIAGDAKVAVFALSADGLTLVPGSPLVCFDAVTDLMTKTTKNETGYFGMVALDDESQMVLFLRSMEAKVWEKQPASYIVRGTFSDEANAEDDVLVAAGGAANVAFNAPAGYHLTGVKVNGVADNNFTPAGYTYVNAAIDGHVYVEMTVEQNPVAQIGATTYTTLAAAFAAAQANDKIELLQDIALTECLTVTDFQGTLDLKGYEITNDESYKQSAGWLMQVNGASDLVVTNGTITVKDGLMVYVFSDATLTIAANTTIDEHGDVANVFRLYAKKMSTGGEVAGTATLNVYGTMTRTAGTQGNNDWEMGVIDQCVGTTVVNVYDGAVITHASGRTFKMSGGTPTVNVYGGTLTAGSNGQMFHAYASGTDNTVNITGGIFNMGKLFSGSGAGKTLVVSGLGNGCTAKFATTASDVESLGYFCDSGYGPVLVNGYYEIKKVWNVTFYADSVVSNAQVVADGVAATNFVYDTTAIEAWTNAAFTAGYDFETGITADAVFYAKFAAPAPAGWDDVAAGDGQSATELYDIPSTAKLANVDAGKLGHWATDQKIDLADFQADPDAYVDAYLLDCAVSEVTEKKADFLVDSITFDGTKWVVTAVDELGNGAPYKNGKIVIKSYSDVGCTTEDPNGNFFKATLQPISYNENQAE